MHLLFLRVLLIRGACSSPVVRAVCQADAAAGGDDNRRRKNTNRKVWSYNGLPDVVISPADDVTRNDPVQWLWRAIEYGFAKRGTTTLRRPFFYKARRSFAVCTKHVKDSIQIINKNNT